MAEVIREEPEKTVVVDRDRPHSNVGVIVGIIVVILLLLLLFGGHMLSGGGSSNTPAPAPTSTH